jgi:hypothetical protein
VIPISDSNLLTVILGDLSTDPILQDDPQDSGSPPETRSSSEYVLVMPNISLFRSNWFHVWRIEKHTETKGRDPR